MKMIILKSEPKHNDREILMMTMRHMVQIHHEQHAERDRERVKILMMVMRNMVQIHDQLCAERERKSEQERERQRHRERESARENGKRKAL